MKRIISFVATVCAIAVFMGCADKPPSVRVTNQRANKANVQFKQSNSNTINQNGVEPGTTTNFQDITSGITEVKADIQNEDLAEKSFVATDNNNYTIVILTGDPPTIRIDEQSK